MSDRTVLIASPYAADASRGNSVSARRIQGILAELDYRPEHVEGVAGVEREGSLMIALHARKSAPAIRAYRASFPNRPLIVLLTGSDLYVDLFEEGEFRELTLESMRQADRLVVCQERSLDDIPRDYRDKSRVVTKSVDMTLPKWEFTVDQDPFRVIIASHLRPVKDPLLIAKAAEQLPADSRLQVTHYGNAELASLGQEAEEASSRLGDRYHWKGQVNREVVMESLATAHLALNTSRVEGGANALCEPLVMGMPCVATSIPANEGMLGLGHPGLFPVGDANALAEILWRAESDAVFYQSLIHASQDRGPLFTRQAERESWGALLAELLESRGD